MTPRKRSSGDLDGADVVIRRTVWGEPHGDGPRRTDAVGRTTHGSTIAQHLFENGGGRWGGVHPKSTMPGPRCQTLGLFSWSSHKAYNLTRARSDEEWICVPKADDSSGSDRPGGDYDSGDRAGNADRASRHSFEGPAEDLPIDDENELTIPNLDPTNGAPVGECELIQERRSSNELCPSLRGGGDSGYEADREMEVGSQRLRRRSQKKRGRTPHVLRDQGFHDDVAVELVSTAPPIKASKLIILCVKVVLGIAILLFVVQKLLPRIRTACFGG